MGVDPQPPFTTGLLPLLGTKTGFRSCSIVAFNAPMPCLQWFRNSRVLDQKNWLFNNMAVVNLLPPKIRPKFRVYENPLVSLK